MERKNLWAPWRIQYIQGLSQKGSCFLCDYVANPKEDTQNFVLWRTPDAVVVFNRFPYNNGHLLIAPIRHIGSMDQATDMEMTAMIRLIRDCQKALSLTIRPHGFNVGMNFGRCAGAGLPDHMHIHVVPRWDGDTNFMHVCSDVDVISQGMIELYEQMADISKKNNLPSI
jgi:ATP adenylyltransferase